MIPLLGIENPLMDFIIHTDYDKVRKFTDKPGTMNLVEAELSARILNEFSSYVTLPGGSCSNTLRGFAWLSADEENPPVYAGAVGKDDTGYGFESQLKECGVRPALAFKDVPTGCSRILVTPDHERTMFTCLSACREYRLDDFHLPLMEGVTIFHTTGYMWDTENQKNAAKSLMKEAKRRNRKVSFDLADPFVVNRYGEELKQFLPGKIDILFANREELSSITGKTETEDVIAAALRFAPLIIMKSGAQGCVLGNGKDVFSIPAEKVTPLDTTGAGDSFAAATLYGLIRNLPLQLCGRLANRLAARIVMVEGCDYSQVDREDVLSIL